MIISSLLEAGMLICWGASWPFQVTKTYSSKDVRGKSILFLWLIETGYILGLCYKAFYHYDYVIFLYLLNFIFVAAEIILYYAYKPHMPIRAQKIPAKVFNAPADNNKDRHIIR